MEIVERRKHGEPTPADQLPETQTVEWVHPEYDRLRLISDREAPDQPTVWKLEGHGDDAATAATLAWRGPGANRNARLYLACYLEANGFERPPSDVAHFVPTAALDLPTRYVSALLLSGTNNSPKWVARRRGLDRDTVYAHVSRVSADYPQIFTGKSEPALTCSECGNEWPFSEYGLALENGAKLARDACPECHTPADVPRRSVSEFETVESADALDAGAAGSD